MLQQKMKVEADGLGTSTTSSCGWRSSVGTKYKCIVTVSVIIFLLFISIKSLWNGTKQQSFYKNLSSTIYNNVRSVNNNLVRDNVNSLSSTGSTSSNSKSSSSTTNINNDNYYNNIPKEKSNDNTTIALNDIYKELSNIEKKLLRQKELKIDSNKNSDSKQDITATTGTSTIDDKYYENDEIMKQEQVEQLQYGCSNYQYTNGSWIKNNSSIQVSNSYFWNVYNDENNTKKCILDEFSIPKFCEKLNGRSILFVGDSITGQYVDAMEELFAVPSRTSIQYIPKQTIDAKLILAHKTSPICTEYYKNLNSNSNSNKQSYVTFVRNDHLLPTPYAGIVDNGNIISPWVHLLSSHSVLVINTGAHRRSLDDYETNLKTVKQTIIDTNYTGHVFFRTTPRGHINCSNTIDIIPIAINPKKSLESNKEYSSFFVNFTSKKMSDYYYNIYHYSDFPKYNAIAKEIFSSSSVSSISSKNGTTSYKLIAKSSSNGTRTVSNQMYTTNTNNERNKNIIWKVIDIAPILELRPDIHKCYNSDWLHDMNKLVVLQIFWKLLYNGLQDFV